MMDYLKEYCKDKSIGLLYVDSEPVILTGIIYEGSPAIKASKIFSECPKEVADAIINFYTDYKHQDKYLSTIKNYAEENLITIDYKIEPANEDFIGYINQVINNEQIKGNPMEVSPGKNTSSLVEMDISSITKKDFHGTITEIEPDEMFKATSDDVIELDIVISPFDA